MADVVTEGPGEGRLFTSHSNHQMNSSSLNRCMYEASTAVHIGHRITKRAIRVELPSMQWWVTEWYWRAVLEWCLVADAGIHHRLLSILTPFLLQLHKVADICQPQHLGPEYTLRTSEDTILWFCLPNRVVYIGQDASPRCRSCWDCNPRVCPHNVPSSLGHAIRQRTNIDKLWCSTWHNCGRLPGTNNLSLPSYTDYCRVYSCTILHHFHTGSKEVSSCMASDPAAHSQQAGNYRRDTQHFCNMHFPLCHSDEWHSQPGDFLPTPLACNANNFYHQHTSPCRSDNRALRRTNLELCLPLSFHQGLTDVHSVHIHQC